MIDGRKLGLELRELIKALFGCAEPPKPLPSVYTVTVSWDPPQPKGQGR